MGVSGSGAALAFAGLDGCKDGAMPGTETGELVDPAEVASCIIFMTKNYHVQYEETKDRLLWREDIVVAFSDRGLDDIEASPELKKLLKAARSGEFDDAVELSRKIAVELKKIVPKIPPSKDAPTFGIPAKLGRRLMDLGNLGELEIGLGDHFVILISEFIDTFPELEQ
jgi:hypothetical protein